MPEDRIEPQFISTCECCERDAAATICRDVQGNAVRLCSGCADMLTPGSWLVADRRQR